MQTNNRAFYKNIYFDRTTHTHNTHVTVKMKELSIKRIKREQNAK